MKQIGFLLIGLLLIAISCKEEKLKPKYAIISGNITNKPIDDITINTFDRSFKEVLELDDSGSFTDTLDTDISQYVIFDGKNPIFLHLEDGYQLTINYDASDFDNSLSITGVGAEANNYLLEKHKIQKEVFGNANETYSLNENDYKAKMQLIKTKNDSLLNSYEVSDNFMANETKELHYAYLNSLNTYENAHRYFTQNQGFVVSDGFLNELDAITYDNDVDYNNSNSYKALATNHYQKEAQKLAELDSVERDIAYLKTVSSIENNIVKNGLLFEFANNSMGYSKDVEAFYKMYSANSTNEKNNKVIEEKYNKLQALNEGKPSPIFSDYKNYEGGTTSLKDLQGKYVYIDVWATWCGPCIREIPSLKEVEAKYHDSNVEFVSISIDKASDYEKWKQMVAEKELGGVQLFADNDWNSQFVQEYQIQGIPRFILIDPQGNIVNSNAPRPSDPKLVDLLESLEM